MKILLKLIIFFVPTTFIVMFFILLTNDETYPGADYNSFELPPFRLDNLANSDLITKDTLEGNFILNVWASWCITCRIEHPYLMNLNNNGIPIIGLNYKDERDDAINWLNKYGNPYDLTVHDYKGTLALDLGVTGAPETFLVHNGKVVAHYQGEVNKFIWEDVFLPVIKEREIF